MRIGVYAIAKDEAANIPDWLAACGEADIVCVTDTGSKDDTVKLLLDGGAAVTQYDKPFRFDEARNYALGKAKRYDMDIWLSLDMDELPEKGWRDKLEAAADGAKGWRITIDNGDYSFQNTRAHRIDGWTWRHACHEVLCGPGPIKDGGFKVRHKQDLSKSRDYLPLLELDAKENPEDGRALHYLGREYIYRRQWQQAATVLRRSLLWDKWPEQRSMSCVYLSRCYWRLADMTQAKEWAVDAIKDHGSREAWVNLAWLLDQLRDPTAAIAARCATEIHKAGAYPPEPGAWGPLAEEIKARWAG